MLAPPKRKGTGEKCSAKYGPGLVLEAPPAQAANAAGLGGYKGPITTWLAPRDGTLERYDICTGFQHHGLGAHRRVETPASSRPLYAAALRSSLPRHRLTSAAFQCARRRSRRPPQTLGDTKRSATHVLRRRLLCIAPVYVESIPPAHRAPSVFHDDAQSPHSTPARRIPTGRTRTADR